MLFRHCLFIIQNERGCRKGKAFSVTPFVCQKLSSCLEIKKYPKQQEIQSALIYILKMKVAAQILSQLFKEQLRFFER